MNDTKTTAPITAEGEVWTTGPRGREKLESGSMRDAVIRSEAVDPEEWARTDWDRPVWVRLSINQDGRVQESVQTQTTVGAWLALRRKVGGEVLAWLMRPTLRATYHPQAWVDKHAQDLDDGAVTFDGLAAMLELTDGERSMTAEDLAREHAQGHWDVLAETVPAAGIHYGPFRVSFDAAPAFALMAICAGDDAALADALGGAADDADWVTQEHLERARVLVRMLQPPQTLQKHRLAIPLEVASRGEIPDIAEVRMALHALLHSEQDLRAALRQAAAHAPAGDAEVMQPERPRGG
ncbi:hypothetical protein [Ramlibacter sp. AN1133]|uniref:hypothetical protein n=1 Tax=Ramlibacter sp. AN1133 TaxID=3133429 RepID=UPI0030BB8FF8